MNHVPGCVSELRLTVGKEQLAVYRAVDHKRSGPAGRNAPTKDVLCQWL